MSFIDDVIKIQFVNMGYLPSSPYHLLSERRMFKAFLDFERVVDPDTGEFIRYDYNDCYFMDFYPFFDDSVPIPDDPTPGYGHGQHINLREAYDSLRDAIAEKIELHFGETHDPIPNWVYSYMLMRPVTFESNEADIAYMYNLLDIDNTSGQFEFTPEIAYWCCYYSNLWLKRYPSAINKRPPAIFGETHLTKSLRLIQANVLMDSEVIS